jgi:hypothetical protein
LRQAETPSAAVNRAADGSGVDLSLGSLIAYELLVWLLGHSWQRDIGRRVGDSEKDDDLAASFVLESATLVLHGLFVNRA